MGYLNNAVITVDAILTDRGRELLARGDGSFKITQFALSDDEVDYALYDPTNTSGSAFFGQKIENMPLLEAMPKATQNLRYKLTTLPRGTALMPVLDIGYSAITLKQGATLSITPQTLNYLGNNQVFESSGYTITIADVRTMASFEGIGVNTTSAQNLNATTTLGTAVQKTVVGTTINLRATTVNTLFGSSATSLSTSLLVTGRDSGARVTVPITITKNQT
tara:strand:- start:644 stop:1306 length:663 start_codon:yes stop_codon:yes gene_type:complete